MKYVLIVIFVITIFLGGMYISVSILENLCDDKVCTKQCPCETVESACHVLPGQEKCNSVVDNKEEV